MADVTHPSRRHWATSWVDAWSDRGFRVEFSLTLGVFLALLCALTNFLEAIEARQGIVLIDPVLSLFPAHDVTWLTFSLIYVGLFIGIASLSFHPRQLMLALQVYSLTVLFRMALMYLVPLDPPTGMIPLQDPFVEFFGTGKSLTRDLFFSGHTSTMFLLFLTSTRKRMRFAFLSATLLIGVCVIWQHVHYSIDVLVAPFVAYASYRIVVLLGGMRGQL